MIGSHMESREESSGVGELFHNGGLVRAVRYTINIHRQTLGPGGLPIPGLQRIDGAIDFDAARDSSELIGADLALKLADGRHLGIVLKDADGRIESPGGIHRSGCGCC
jgi:hypothetical protein